MVAKKALTGREHSSTETLRQPTPPLENGDRLSRHEFERRYTAMPHLRKAELIEGVVYVPSPLRFENHAEPHGNLIGWMDLPDWNSGREVRDRADSAPRFR